MVFQIQALPVRHIFLLLLLAVIFTVGTLGSIMFGKTIIIFFIFSDSCVSFSSSSARRVHLFQL
jgi:cytochrome b561